MCGITFAQPWLQRFHAAGDSPEDKVSESRRHGGRGKPFDAEKFRKALFLKDRGSTQK